MKLRLELEEELSGALRAGKGARDRPMRLTLRHSYSFNLRYIPTYGVIDIAGLASSCAVSGELEVLNGELSYTLRFESEGGLYAVRALKRSYLSDPYAGLTTLRGSLSHLDTQQSRSVDHEVKALGQVLLRFDARASLSNLWRSLSVHA